METKSACRVAGSIVGGFEPGDKEWEDQTKIKGVCFNAKGWRQEVSHRGSFAKMSSSFGRLVSFVPLLVRFE